MLRNLLSVLDSSNGSTKVSSKGSSKNPKSTKGAGHAPIVSDLTDHETLQTMPLSVVIFGATGDLAKKKLFPALYQLCLHGHLPRTLDIIGYGRKPVVLDDFIAKQCVNIKEDSRLPRAEFVARIRFHAGGYDAEESYSRLDESMKVYEAGKPGNRLYFLSVPPTIFGASRTGRTQAFMRSCVTLNAHVVTCHTQCACGHVSHSTRMRSFVSQVVTAMISSKARAVAGGYTRLMIEKPFGRDSESFDALNLLTAQHFDESQLFRLDHYLGKEVGLLLAFARPRPSHSLPLTIQIATQPCPSRLCCLPIVHQKALPNMSQVILNIATLRWANRTFEPTW